MSNSSKTKNENRVPEKIEINALELKTIELRINGVKEATHRSRFVFVIMTILTATILIALWNATLSWDRGVAFGERSTDEIVAQNRETVRNEWLKNTFISVGLLGIRVSVTDLAVLGSGCLIIVMIWFFFSQRRENRAIVSLLQYCKKRFNSQRLSKEACNLVYVGVIQNIVFIDMGGGDEPIKGIDADATAVEQTSFVRGILIGLVYLPPFTILMIIISDIASLFMDSYLRDPGKALGEALYDSKDFINWSKIILFDSFAFFSLIYTAYLCSKCRQFSIATSATIKEFEDFLKPKKNVSDSLMASNSSAIKTSGM